VRGAASCNTFRSSTILADLVRQQHSSANVRYCVDGSITTAIVRTNAFSAAKAARPRSVSFFQANNVSTNISYSFSSKDEIWHVSVWRRKRRVQPRRRGQVSARSALFGPASTLPFLPMRWMDLDRPPQFSVHPRIANATAGKNEGMDRPPTVNNCEPYIVVRGNIRGAIELVPHAYH